MLLAYNKDLLRKYGAPDPWDKLNGKWDWNDFLGIARQVTQPAGGEFAGGSWGLAMDGNGVASRFIIETNTTDAPSVLRVTSVTTYRSATRVAVEVWLELPENAPQWKPEGASLTHQGKKGVELKLVTLWPSALTAPGVFGGGVSVEAEATPDVATGTFMLKLWDASGARTVTLRGIKFP